MRNSIRYYILISFIISLPIIYAQESSKYSGDYANFYRAERLFEKQQYSAAQATFSTFIEDFNQLNDPLYVKAKYYQALAALKLYNRNAVKLLLSFIREYPESIYRNSIYFKLGTHFYQRKKYEETKKWLAQTDITKLDSSAQTAYHFKLGYAYFQLEEYTNARNEFYEIKDGTSNYTAPALYYYSYIEYINESYQEALDGFLVLLDNSTFQKEVKKYIIQIYYLMENYEKVTEYAPQFSSDKGIDENTAEMNLIIGQAYYKVQKYDEAVPFLENYYQRKETTREENYALGYAYFKVGSYQKAIAIFDRVAEKRDQLSQISYYHIAQAYLKEEKLNYARTAFKSAADIEADQNIQEDALYNYAVLSYKLDYNPYNEAIKAFELFLSKFPKSSRKENVYNYLVNVYSNTKNYQAALASLDRIPNKNIKLKMAYQIVTYNMGIGLYEKSDYQEAIDALAKVFIYQVNPTIEGKAKFWQADASYMLQNWSEAIATYRDFLIIPGVNSPHLKEAAYYNIAYAYFMQDDWTQAISAFRTFIQLPNIQDKKKLSDAYIRLGDCYYTKTSPDFKQAAENYKHSLQYKGAKKDEVLFALARVYKLTPGKREEQIKTLNQLLDQFPQSTYEIQAILELGTAYKNKGNYDRSLMSYRKIVKSFPSNIAVKNALIGIGDIKFKQGHYEEAESYFQRVLDEYTLDDETCKSVTQSLVDIYRATRQQEKIAQIGTKYACAGISKEDEEVFYYETASELYVNKKYKKAIPEIKKYLHQYPNGRFSTQLITYLGNIFYQKDQKDSAIYYYQQVINRPLSSYTEQVLARTSKWYYNTEQYEEALPIYQKLEKVTSDPNTLFNTRIGLMRTNYLLENYMNAALSSEKVLNDKLLDKEAIKLEGNYIAGMAYFYLKKYQKGIINLQWTADHTGTERGTEALFSLSKSYFELGEFSKTEKIHKQLMKRKPAYDYWIARSLILQAKVFIEKEDLFQAEQTINLVIDNYPNKNDDVLALAGVVKQEISRIKLTPKEIENESNRTIELNNNSHE